MAKSGWGRPVLRDGPTVLLSLLLSSSTLAHDFWLEPTSFTPAAGELVKVKLWVGEHLKGETVPRNDRLIDRFAAIQGGSEAAVLGLDASDPAGILRPQTPGGIVIAYRSSRSSIELPADRFAAYLELEGLKKVKPGREVFSRCAKSLLAVGGLGGPAFTRPVGLTLELIPETDPYTLRPGAGLVVRVLYQKRPLANALVMALDAEHAEAPQRVRSDERGRARFTLPRAGTWLIKVVHMIPAPADAGADWESFWASLTFSLPAGKP